MARRRRSFLNSSALSAEVQVSDLSKYFVIMFTRKTYLAAYSSVISTLRRTQAPGLGTMGVRNLPQGGAELVYDPLFNEMVATPDYRPTVGKILIHEMVHLQDNHTGRGLRLYQIEQDKEMWAKVSPVAVDFACNSSCVHWNLFTKEDLLSSQPYELDADGLPLKDDEGRLVSKWRGLWPEEYDLPVGLSYENYYKILSDIEKGKPPKEWLPEPPPTEGGEDGGSGTGSSDDEGSESDSKDGDKDSKSDSSDLEKKMQKVKDLLERHKQAGKKYVHAEDLSDISEDQIEDLIASADSASIAASKEISNALKSRGLGSSNLAMELEERLKDPVLDAKQIIRAMVIQESLKVGKKKSLQVPNRRRTALERTGVCLFPGKKKDTRARVAFFVDTSGSVSSDEFEEGRAEFVGLHNYLKEVTVVYCDSDITNIEKLSGESKFPAKRYGCGGTSFDPPFAWLKEQPTSYDMVVYLTDGGAPLPSESLRVGLPVLWLITSRGCLPGNYYNDMVVGKLYGAAEGLSYGTAIKLPHRL